MNLISTTNIGHYLLSRIEHPKYRGAHITQHNRLTLGRVLLMLRALHAVAGKAVFAIPSDSQITQTTPGFEKYFAMVDKDGSTPKTLKKVFFPDFEQMGLLARMGKDGRIRKGKQQVFSACLTETAARLLNADMPEAQQMYSKIVRRLVPKEIMEVMKVTLAKFGNLSVWEYMLILSDLRPLSDERAINLLTEYRTFSEGERQSLRQEVQKKCECISAKARNKKGKRDFGNWLNQADSAFVIFNETGLFKVQGTGKQAMIALCPE